LNDPQKCGAAETGLAASLATLPASLQRRWWSFGAIVSLLAVFCLAAPFGKLPLAQSAGIVPAVHGTIFVTDLTTAVWLFAQVSLLRSRALLALAIAYLFTAVIVFAHTLTFPGAFAQRGLLGAGTQTTGWLYIIWLSSLPLAVLAYAVLKHAPGARPRRIGSPRAAIFWSVIGVIGSVCAIVWGLAIGDKLIPALFLDRFTYSPIIPYIGGSHAVLCGMAFLYLASRKPTVLESFLAISVAATMAEMAITTFFSAARYDIGWYASVGFELVSSNAVFLALVSEFTRLFTQAQRQIETQHVLVAELQHRTRNLMAVVQSIAHQTLDAAGSLPAFEDRFNRRLEALSRVQGLLSRAEIDPVTLGSLVAMEFDALGVDASGGKMTFAGPDVPLRRDAVEILALAIHELLTNAIKYGALASPTGQLSVNWEIEGTAPARHVVLEWMERGAAPSGGAGVQRHGYGRTLIEEALPYSLGAETRFELGADTLYCRISLPLAANDIGEAAA
jgi:two-component sensor histidine kinase